jgi:chromosome segregation ATPase
MDMNQAARMIEWLDEERRRDKTTIATLEERLAQQQDIMETLQRRLNSMESDQTVMSNTFVPHERENDLIDNVRKEMRQLIESSEAKRLTAERESERRGEIARDNILRSVREVNDRLSGLEKQSGEVSGLQVERDRLANAVATLQQRFDDLVKQLEEPDRRLAFLEEQRRQDARRISEAETNMPEIQKQVDTIRPKVDLLEDLALRNERRVQETQNSERERREQIQQFIDQQNLLIQERDQQMKELVQRFGEQENVMVGNIERFETWAEAYRNMKKIIDDFERIGDRLERRINEVAEMQRLSEERFRQEWNDWRSDDQKQWKQFTLSNDEVWRSHDKDFERFVQQTSTLAETIQPLQDSLARLWNLERDRAQLYRERYQSLLHEYDTGIVPSSSITASGDNSNGTP